LRVCAAAAQDQPQCGHRAPEHGVQDLIELENKHDFTIARDGWVGDYLDPNTMLELFITDSGNNSGDHRNPAFDKLMEDARMPRAMRA
jgi:ABC-type oligopeptide transport system substrate-binding subunit